MCEMLQQKMEANPNWIRDVWFRDEAHFHINGAVNSHNNIFWGSQRPDEVEEKSLQGRKVTAFVAVRYRGVFGPYWFEDKNGRTVTISQERYRSIVNAFYEDLKQSMSTAALRRQWFMQDGATPHTANETIAFLRQKFGQRVLSLRMKNDWSPHSPDLNLLDFFFLWESVRITSTRNTPDLKLI